MRLVDYKSEALKYIIGYFRQNRDVSDFLQKLVERANSIENAILTLLNSYNIRQARGVFLDYAGKEVGAERDEPDISNYFCVNMSHINQNKLFYFLSSGDNPSNPISLEDAEFIQKIFAYIGTNISSGNLEETISIIKTATNADNVIITKGVAGGVKINIIGRNLVLTSNSVTYIKQILADGIYIEEITTNE